jgi:hypothetical protein
MEVLEFENCVQIINVIIGVNDAIDFLCTSGIGNLLICDVKFTLTTENNGVYTTELIKPESVICWTDEQYCVPVTDCNDGAFVGTVDYDLCVLFARIVLSKLFTFFPERKTLETDLEIIIHTRQDNTCYGYTVIGIKTQIHIFVGHHVSETHFLGTLAHEISHFLTDGNISDHGDFWKTVFCCVMCLLKTFIDENDVHEMMVASRGANVMEK